MNGRREDANLMSALQAVRNKPVQRAICAFTHAIEITREQGYAVEREWRRSKHIMVQRRKARWGDTIISNQLGRDPMPSRRVRPHRRQ